MTTLAIVLLNAILLGDDASYVAITFREEQILDAAFSSSGGWKDKNSLEKLLKRCQVPWSDRIELLELFREFYLKSISYRNPRVTFLGFKWIPEFGILMKLKFYVYILGEKVSVECNVAVFSRDKDWVLADGYKFFYFPFPNSPRELGEEDWSGWIVDAQFRKNLKNYIQAKKLGKLPSKVRP